MAQAVDAFAQRICYYLGIYKERIDALEEEIKHVTAQRDALLDGNQNIYIVNCEAEGCPNWNLCNSGLQRHDNGINIRSYDCGHYYCHDCAHNVDEKYCRIFEHCPMCGSLN